MMEMDERWNLKVIRSLGTFRNVCHRWKETHGPVCITGEGSIMAVTLRETWREKPLLTKHYMTHLLPMRASSFSTSVLWS